MAASGFVLLEQLQFFLCSTPIKCPPLHLCFGAWPLAKAMFCGGVSPYFLRKMISLRIPVILVDPKAGSDPVFRFKVLFVQGVSKGIHSDQSVNGGRSGGPLTQFLKGPFMPEVILGSWYKKTWVRPGGTTFPARPDQLFSWGLGAGGSGRKRKQVSRGLLHFPFGADEQISGVKERPGRINPDIRNLELIPRTCL